jgi:hypothetical protein
MVTMMTITFSQTATLESHDRRRSVRICPRAKPTMATTASAKVTVCKSAAYQIRTWIPHTADEPSASFSGRHLAQRLPILLNDQSNHEKELEALQDVEEISRPIAEDAERKITVIAHWIPGRIQTDKHLPDLEPGVTGETTKDSVKSKSWTVSHLTDGPWHVVWSQDISGDQIKNRTWSLISFLHGLQDYPDLDNLMHAYPR